MDVLSALLIGLIVIAILFEIAQRVGVPYPALFVLGGVGMGFVPGLPHIALQPDLVLLVFLPPLLFGAAFETPLRDLRANLWPIGRLSIGLVIFSTAVVAVVAQAMIPDLGWPAAFALGAIVAPTDALAATSVFRRLGISCVADHPDFGSVHLPAPGETPIPVEKLEKPSPILQNVLRRVFVESGKVERILRHGADAAETRGESIRKSICLKGRANQGTHAIGLAQVEAGAL